VKFLILILIFLSSCKLPETMSRDEGSLRLPKELSSQIIDKAGAQIPTDILMTDHNGKKVLLGDYLNDKPVIITLSYGACPMLCQLVLNGLVNGLKGVSYKPGKDYRIVSLSIDDKETPEKAKEKRDSYVKSFDYPTNIDWWTFHVADSEEIKRLADSLGFNYFYDQKSRQFAHGAGIFVLSKKAILSRTLFGIEFKPGDIKLALSEAADGKIGSFVDQIILSCFHYDPDSHKYGVYIFGIMRLSGLLTIVILGVMLLMYFRGERKRVNSVV
jgi:protein SCO1/2